MDRGGTSQRAKRSPLAGAALSGALEAARALERACRDSDEGRDGGRHSLYLRSVADLARDLGNDLNSLDRTPDVPSAASLVSAALRAADLATLAACALQELPPHSPECPRIAAAAHTACGAARSLALERRATENGEDYAALDLRGAEWRASLAARQTDEALQAED